MKSGLGLYANVQNQSLFFENKVEMTIKIYEKIIYSINKTIQFINEKNTEEKIRHITKAIDLIELGLLKYLNSDNIVGETLKNFYISSILVLTKTNLRNNVKDLQKIADSFIEVKKSWETIK